MAWDRLSPIATSALASSPVRSNFQAIDLAYLGNVFPDPYHMIWPNGGSLAGAGFTLAGAGAAVIWGLAAGEFLIGDRSVKLTLGSATLTYSKNLLLSIPPELKGKTISIGIGVRTATANLCKAQIDDGVGTTDTPFHTGGDSFEWLTATRTLDASATKLTITYLCAIGGGSGFGFFDATTIVVGPIAPQRFIPPQILEGQLYFPGAGDAKVETRRNSFLSGLPFIVRNVSLEISAVAPTGSSLIVDVNNFDGAAFQSMFTTRPTLAIGEVVNGANPDGVYRYRCFDGHKDNQGQTNSLLTTDVDQVGSTLPGTGLLIRVHTLQFPEPLRAMEAF